MNPIANTNIQYTNAATQTLSMEELCSEYLREHQNRNSRLVDELRELCEELPGSVLDPVTYEVFTDPMVTRCGHTLDRSTINNIYRMERRVDEDGDPVIDCPACREETSVYYIHYDQAFSETIEHLKKIQGVFQDVNGNKTTFRVDETNTE